MLLRAAGAMLAALPALAWSQAAPQVTPRDLRPDLPQAPVPALPQPAPAATPAGAQNLSVTPGRIDVAGGYPEFAAATEALVTPWPGRRVTVAQLYELAEAIEALYRDAGYLLVRVVIPPQNATDGAPFRITVLDGFIEHVDTLAVPAKARARVAALLEPLVGRKRLNNTVLERSLTLAGRGPGLTLKSTLAPGATAGAVVLVLDGEFAPWSGVLSLDNRLSHALGPWQWTAQVRANQPFGRGDQAYAYVSAHPDLRHSLGSGASRRVAGGGVSLPLGTDGWVFNPEFTWSDTRTPAVQFIPETRSRFERLTLRTSYPLRLTRSEELALTGSFDASTQTTTAPEFQATLNEDRLRVLRAGLDYHRGVGETGQLRLSTTLSKGLSGLGARTQEDAAASGIALSRAGADPAFTKLEAALSWDQAWQPLQSRLTVRWQRSLRGVLPGAELFSLDGEDALSTFTSGALSDDSGWTAREEVAWPLAFDAAAGPLQLAPYLFAAAGRLQSRIAPGAAHASASAFGAGLRVNWRALALQAEYGRRQSRPNDLNGHQLFVKAQVQF